MYKIQILIPRNFIQKKGQDKNPAQFKNSISQEKPVQKLTSILKRDFGGN